MAFRCVTAVGASGPRRPLRRCGRQAKEDRQVVRAVRLVFHLVRLPLLWRGLRLTGVTIGRTIIDLANLYHTRRREPYDGTFLESLLVAGGQPEVGAVVVRLGARAEIWP